MKSTREQLLQDGFCIFKNILDSALLAELRQVTDGLISKISTEDVERYKYQGTNVKVDYQHSVFAKLFALPKALAALREVGFDQPKFWSAFMLSKPPHGPPLYWHQDWWAWEDPVSLRAAPPQVFLMYYLTDTDRVNGCLRVIPGTQSRHIHLHDLLPEAHTEAAQKAALNSPAFVQHPDEVDVPVQAGDLVLGDARVLHSAHQNQTDKHRTLLTLWYLPDYDHLPAGIRAFAARKKPLQPPDWWEGDVGKTVEPLMPYYHGDAQPVHWNRNPDALMKHDE